MNLKDFIKNFQRATARYGLFTFSWLAKWVPLKAVRILATGATAVGFCLVIKQRRFAKESLQTAFGNEKTPQEIDHIIQKCFYNLSQGMTEMLYFLSHHKDVSGYVFFEGKEHLDRALGQGRGVIAVTAHFGSFPLMMLHCALSGYPTNAILRPTRDQKIEEYLSRRRKESGIKGIYAIPRRECVVNSLKVLRNNELLFIPLDQNFGSGGGVFVDFFGQKAATATGPVVLARRTGSPILPMFIIRQDDNRHKIIVEPPFVLETTDNEEQDIFKNIARLTALIEQYIRRYPHEWGWMHRRWKSKQPNDSGTNEARKDLKPHGTQ